MELARAVGGSQVPFDPGAPTKRINKLRYLPRPLPVPIGPISAQEGPKTGGPGDREAVGPARVFLPSGGRT